MKPTLRHMLTRLERLINFPKEYLAIYFQDVPQWEQHMQRLYVDWAVIANEEKKTIPDYKKIEFEIYSALTLFGCLIDLKKVADDLKRN